MKRIARSVAVGCGLFLLIAVAVFAASLDVPYKFDLEGKTWTRNLVQAGNVLKAKEWHCPSDDICKLPFLVDIKTQSRCDQFTARFEIQRNDEIPFILKHVPTLYDVRLEKDLEDELGNSERNLILPVKVSLSENCGSNLFTVSLRCRLPLRTAEDFTACSSHVYDVKAETEKEIAYKKTLEDQARLKEVEKKRYEERAQLWSAEYVRQAEARYPSLLTAMASLDFLAGQTAHLSNGDIIVKGQAITNSRGNIRDFLFSPGLKFLAVHIKNGEHDAFGIYEEEETPRETSWDIFIFEIPTKKLVRIFQDTCGLSIQGWKDDHSITYWRSGCVETTPDIVFDVVSGEWTTPTPEVYGVARTPVTEQLLK